MKNYRTTTPTQKYDEILVTSLIEALLEQGGLQLEQNDDVYEWVDADFKVHTENGVTIDTDDSVYIEVKDWWINSEEPS